MGKTHVLAAMATDTCRVLAKTPGPVTQGPFCVCVDWQLWKPMLLRGLACTGRERGASASPSKVASKY